MPIAPTNGYCTGAQLKSALGIATSDTDSDTELEQAIDSASRAIDTYCGRRFWQDASDATYYFTADHQTVLGLGPHPDTVDIASVTSLTVDTAGDGVFDETWTENTHFFLAPRSGHDGVYQTVRVLPSGGRVWPVGDVDAIKIVGVFGRDTPDPVTQACIDLASFHYKKTREAPFDVVGIGFDGAAIRAGGMPSSIRTLLDPYRRIPVY